MGVVLIVVHRLSQQVASLFIISCFWPPHLSLCVHRQDGTAHLTYYVCTDKMVLLTWHTMCAQTGWYCSLDYYVCTDRMVLLTWLLCVHRQDGTAHLAYYVCTDRMALSVHRQDGILCVHRQDGTAHLTYYVCTDKMALLTWHTMCAQTGWYCSLCATAGWHYLT